MQIYAKYAPQGRGQPLHIYAKYATYAEYAQSTRPTHSFQPGPSANFQILFHILVKYVFFSCRCIYFMVRCIYIRGRRICSIPVHRSMKGAACARSWCRSEQRSGEVCSSVCSQFRILSLQSIAQCVPIKRDWCNAAHNQSESRIVGDMLCKKSQQFAVYSHPLYSTIVLVRILCLMCFVIFDVWIRPEI